MTAAEYKLPQGFEHLEPYVPLWAGPTTAARAKLRGVATDDQRADFYKAAFSALPAALERLDQKPLAQLDDSESRLMQLMLSFAHVAHAIEAQGPEEATHAGMREHLHFTRAIADL